MNYLTLQIKREYLDKILSCEKKEEFGEIRQRTPKNSSSILLVIAVRKM